MTITGFAVGDKITMKVRTDKVSSTEEREYEITDIYPYFLRAKDCESNTYTTFNYGDLVSNGYYKRMLYALV